MHEARPVRAVRFRLQLEESTAHLAHASAQRAAQPSRERRHRDANARLRCEWVVRAIASGPDRWAEKAGHLRAQHPPHGTKQPVLTNREANRRIPKVETHDHNGYLRQVDE